ncbi:MAG: HAD family hydrolase [Eggerthellaceae bacterium]
MEKTAQNTDTRVPAQPSYRAIYFDLDGTLLPMDIDDFLREYYRRIITYIVSRVDVDPDKFKEALNKGVRAMGTHASTITNEEAFWDAFFETMDRNKTDWQALFLEFYQTDFGNIGIGVDANPAARQAIETLTEKGYPLVLVTMPMFPEPAVEWRLTWAGINPALFGRLTTFDNSRATKPRLEYYAENFLAAGLAPEDVLMVGNNTREDLAVLDYGADAYLVTDFLINPNDFNIATVKHGSLKDFAAWVETLPNCENPALDIETGLVDSNRCRKFEEEITQKAAAAVARGKAAAEAAAAEATATDDSRKD